MLSQHQFDQLKEPRSLCTAALSLCLAEPQDLLQSSDAPLAQTLADLISQTIEALVTICTQIKVRTTTLKAQASHMPTSTQTHQAYQAALHHAQHLANKILTLQTNKRDASDTVLAAGYQELFSSKKNMAPSAPIESLYKSWTEDPSCTLLIAREKSHLMGDSALHMKELLERYEISITPHIMPDHLCVEFSLYELLIQHAPRKNQAEFLADHLNWLDQLETACEERIRTASPTHTTEQQLYFEIVVLCRLYTQAEAQLLERETEAENTQTTLSPE